MTAPYPRRKKNETIANQICSKIIWGKTDPTILNQMTNFEEFLATRCFTPEELAEYLPFLKDRSYDDMVEIFKSVYEQLSERINNRENSVLQTYRIYVALKVLKPDKNIPMNNPMIKLCRYSWENDGNTSMKKVLKNIALIDQCIMMKKCQT
ncbi:MAG: hypothetical protein IJO08_01330 [Clostridia bacterium]|nr:hypothetical protein [Clostridia bacterium]